ncbi:hypothetical protein CABS01_00970 [Colletotrichum abscissum]|uniref:uncharacterized protein n=1 Tax=Colletotrichum abscissum TaxID=1671311 RepID=UPI0027D5E501|nr:uncharacterized protein CABS01_00970 [Colletotrichum abscissum]KAK1505502.1 hypothetical protein CABS01_00970 [Colletotrichum abscissum]
MTRDTGDQDTSQQIIQFDQRLRSTHREILSTRTHTQKKARPTSWDRYPNNSVSVPPLPSNERHHQSPQSKVFDPIFRAMRPWETLHHTTSSPESTRAKGSVLALICALSERDRARDDPQDHPARIWDLYARSGRQIYLLYDSTARSRSWRLWSGLIHTSSQRRNTFLAKTNLTNRGRLRRNPHLNMT